MPELVQEPFHDEGGDSLIVIWPGETYGELLGLHRIILPEFRPSADEPPAHDLDRDQGQRSGKDEHPGHVDEYSHRRSRGELPAHVVLVVEPGEPGVLRLSRHDVVSGGDNPT